MLRKKMNNRLQSNGHPGERRLIESDLFPFEFISQLAEMESWRKEVYRPIYHIHKWWAKRLGSVFRGILLGSALPDSGNLMEAFYKQHDFAGVTVFDPFMGSGTTIGEAHKLGEHPVRWRMTNRLGGFCDRKDVAALLAGRRRAACRTCV